MGAHDPPSLLCIREDLQSVSPAWWPFASGGSWIYDHSGTLPERIALCNTFLHYIHFPSSFRNTGCLWLHGHFPSCCRFKFWRESGFIFLIQKHKEIWSFESQKCHTSLLVYLVTERAPDLYPGCWESQVMPLHLPLIFQVVLRKLIERSKHLDPRAPGGVRWHTGGRIGFWSGGTRSNLGCRCLCPVPR